MEEFQKLFSLITEAEVNGVKKKYLEWGLLLLILIIGGQFGSVRAEDVFEWEEASELFETSDALNTFDNPQNQPQSDITEVPELIRGQVLEIITQEKMADPLTGEPTAYQNLKVRLDSGTHKGKIISVTNYETSNPVFNIRVHPGDKILVALEEKADGSINAAFVADHLREPQLYLLLILFIVLVLAIGWKKGAKAIAGLLLTLVLIWGVLLPGILRGYPPILLTVITAVAVIAITTLVIGGLSLKSLAAILGTIGGVVISGILALVVGKAAHLTGFGNESAAMLLYIPQNIHLDIQGLLFAGIIIGALGATMDMSISVASTVTELKRVNPGLGCNELIKSGMNVGQDVIGTMANTLILAYTGGSLQLILIFMAYQESVLKIINLDMVASEIVRALAGSIGMIMVVPFTAVISGWLMGSKRDTSLKL